MSRTTSKNLLLLVAPMFINVPASAPLSNHQPYPPVPERHKLEVQVTTDVVTAIPYNKIKFVQGATTKVYLTDSLGFSPALAIQPDNPMGIFLKEKTLSDGVALGQHFTHSYPDQGSELDVFNTLQLVQPLLESVTGDSSQPWITESSKHARWVLYPEPNSSYSFSANIGLLLTAREIQAFEEYYSVDFDDNEYSLGLVIQTSAIEDFGSSAGIGLQLDCTGHGFSVAPGADSYFVSTNASNFGVATFEATPVAWEELTPETANYVITGTLGKGMNILLFHGGAGESPTDLLASSPQFGPLSQYIPDPVMQGDCSPAAPTPSPGFDCTPNVMQSSSDCPGGSCPVNDRQVFTHPVGGAACGGSGDAVTRKYSWQIEGSFSVNFKGPAGEAGPTGTYSYGEEEEVSMSFSNGAGCGECKQVFRHVVVHTKCCVVHLELFAFFGPCVDKWDCGTCHDLSGPSITSCPRSCQ